MLSRLVLVCFIMQTFVPAMAQTAPGEKPSTPALELRIKTDRETYRMDDEIKLETRLLNISKQDIYIWERDLCWNPAHGLSIFVTTDDGKGVQGRFLFDCLPAPPKEGDIYEFVKLVPDGFHGRVDDFKVRDLINKPGGYNIQVSYKSFLSEGSVKEFLRRDPISKLPLWTMEKPEIHAAQVHVVIEP